MELRAKVLKPFLPMYTTNARYIVMYGGRNGAKSFGSAQYMLLKSFEPKFKGAVLRATLATTDNSVKDQLDSVADLMGIRDKFESISKELTNNQSGNKMSFLGFQTSSKLQDAKTKSLTDYTHIWIEEGSEIKLEDFEKLDLSIRTTGTELRIIIAFNTPHIRHWLREEFFDAAGNPLERDDVLYIKTTYHDLKPEMVDASFVVKTERMKLKNLDHYNHVILGDWQAEDDDQIYRGWNALKVFPVDLPFMYGLDFGFNHPTAITKCAISGNQLFVQEMLYKSNLLPSDRIEFCLSLGHDATFVADSAAADAIAEMRNKRIRTIDAVKGPNSVLKGIEDIQDMEVFICGESSNIWNEYYEYKWAAHKIPRKESDDAMDSIRYCVKQLKRGNRKNRYSVA